MAKNRPEEHESSPKKSENNESAKRTANTTPGSSAEGDESAETTEAPETNDSALREASKNATRVHKEAAQHETDQAKANAEREVAAVVSRSIREADGKVFITTKIGEEESVQELGDSQTEGYNRYKNIEWKNDGEKAAAEAITRYSFGDGTPEQRKDFEEHVFGLNEEESRAFYKIAKKLDLGVVTKKHFKELQEEDED